MLNIHEMINGSKPEELLTPELRWKFFQRAFSTIRDIPYSCRKSPGRSRALDEYLENFLARGRGTCTQKHLLLGLAAESLGWRVRYLSYQFYWQNLQVEYPTELGAILKEMPAQIHTALSVSPDNDNQGKYYVADCTWDQPLESTGFPVNCLRDVPHDCDLGVIPHTLPVLHHLAIGQWTYLQEIKSAMPPNKSVLLFYDKFDEWLVLLRSGFTSCDRQDNNSSPRVDCHSLIAIAQFGNY